MKEESEIRRHGLTSSTYKADFKTFNLAISPRLESLLCSGERLASFTDSHILPSQLSLQLVTLSSQVANAPKNSSTDELFGHLLSILSSLSCWQQLPAL